MATTPELHLLARLMRAPRSTLPAALAMGLALASTGSGAGPVVPAVAPGAATPTLRMALATTQPVAAQVPKAAEAAPGAKAPGAASGANASLALDTKAASASAAKLQAAQAIAAAAASTPSPKPLAAAAAASAPSLPPMPAAPSKPSASARQQAVACLISPERVADVGSQVVGIVKALQADSGDTVREGQPLVVLAAEVEKAGVEAAEARSTIEADVRAAEANLELARQRHVRATELQAQGFFSSQASDQARAEMDVAAQRLEQARGQQTVSRRELGVVRAQLNQRVVRSPFEGVVVDRYINIGERVEDRPVMRVAMLNPLRVELVMPASRYGTVALKDRVTVQPELPGAGAVTASVTHVDKVIDAASNTFRVRMSLPNPGHKLPAGARCKLTQVVEAATAAPEPTPQAPGKVSANKPGQAKVANKATDAKLAAKAAAKAAKEAKAVERAAARQAAKPPAAAGEPGRKEPKSARARDAVPKA